MPKILTNRSKQVSVSLLLADLLVFCLVNPARASAPWLIIGYVLLGLSIVKIAGIVASLFKAYGDTAWRRSRRFTRYGAFVIVALVGLQSIGQLTVKDTLAMLPLVAVAYLYFGYSKHLSRESV